MRNTRDPEGRNSQSRSPGLRDGVLDTAADLLAQYGFRRLRMSHLARASGVSRQTLYNEFGSKDGVARAVMLRDNATFLAGLEETLNSTEDEPAEPDELADGATRGSETGAALLRATRYTLRYATTNPLVNAILPASSREAGETGAGGSAEDLLPFLTTRGEPLVRASIDVVEAHLRKRVPELPGDASTDIAETAVRLAMSHLLLPAHDEETTARVIADTVGALIDVHSRQPPNPPSIHTREVSP